MTCPNCSGLIDVDEEELDEGDTLSCDECGSDLKVVSTSPVELQPADKVEEDEEDEDFEDEDEDEDAELEEEDEEADEWS